MQGLYGTKIYIRFGLKPRPTNYQPMEEGKGEIYKSVLAGTNMLKNLQESLCPWTAEPALNQKFNANLMAEVYRSIVRPLELDPQPGQPDEHVLRALGGDRGRYDVLGFLSKTTSSHFVPLQKFIDSNSDLQAFLDKPSVQEAFRHRPSGPNAHSKCLNVAVARELVSSAKLAPRGRFDPGQPADFPGQKHPAAHPARFGPLPQCAAAVVLHGGEAGRLLQGAPAEAMYLQEVSPKERSKIESYYNLLAVVLATRDDGQQEGSLPEWRLLSNTVRIQEQAGKPADYQFALAEGQAIVCLGQGRLAGRLQEPLAKACFPWGSRPPSARRASKECAYPSCPTRSFAGSCLHPRSIARMQFYTSFSAAETLTILRGITQEPTDENIIEALRPCFILKYTDHASSTGGTSTAGSSPPKWCRVRYRTPTGEDQEPVLGRQPDYRRAGSF